MQQPVVTTRNGRIRGTTSADGSVAVFRGIPYAAAPVGPNRFGLPRPVEPWTGELDASQYGATAPKAPYAAPFDVLLPETDIPGADCLNLNVWTPARSVGTAERLPVMVFLHGGAFANGAGSLPGYDGSAFARDGVVLVTLNYRLGADGFGLFDEAGEACEAGEAEDAEDAGGHPANLGLRDQVAALEWVREHIAAFGGDPGKVTLFGESAGAMSIGVLLAVPSAEGLFHRAILQSGAAQHVLSPGTARLIGRRLAELLGVPPTRAGIAGVPPERLLEAQQQLRAAVSAAPDPAQWGEVALNLMPFEPVVDGEFLPASPLARIADGAGSGVDLLVGSNSDEFRLFLAPTGLLDLVPETRLRSTAAGYGLDPEQALAGYRLGRPGAGNGELFAALVTDWFYRIPAIRLAEAHARHGRAGTYLYEFGWQPPTFGGRLGACHASELPFVFDNLREGGFAPLLGPDLPQQLADAVHGAWVAFATGGDPGWPGYDTATRTTMHFDTESGPRKDPRPEERTLWDGHR